MVYDIPITIIQHQSGLRSAATVVDWCNFMREECELWLSNNPDELGERDAKGQPMVDESKHFHRKYHPVNGGKALKEAGKCSLME